LICSTKPMRMALLLALALGSTGSTASAKPIELTHAELDIGLTAVPLWVENRLLEERLIEMRSPSQWGSLLPISPGPARGMEPAIAGVGVGSAGGGAGSAGGGAGSAGGGAGRAGAPASIASAKAAVSRGR
jgi:hypothetical protein